MRLIMWFPYGTYHVTTYAEDGIESLEDIMDWGDLDDEKDAENDHKPSIFTSLPSGQQEVNKRMRYRQVTLGVLEISQPGNYELKLSPVPGGKPGEIILKSISLSPWQ